MLKWLTLIFLISCSSAPVKTNPQIYAILTSNMKSFELCVNKYHDQDLRPIEILNLNFIIDQHGKVISASIDDFSGSMSEDYLDSSRQFTPIINLKTEECLIATLKKLIFPKPSKIEHGASQIQVRQAIQFDTRE